MTIRSRCVERSSRTPPKTDRPLSRRPAPRSEGRSRRREEGQAQEEKGAR